MATRREIDSLGSVEVPSELYYGAQTARAISNFKISGILMPHSLIKAGALIKKHAAAVNQQLALLNDDLAKAICQAAEEVCSDQHKDSFRVDIFQTGSGTSTNMNLNEVIATRANEILTGHRVGKSPVNPNDHVNLGQSSNDVIPSAIHLAAFFGLHNQLLPALRALEEALDKKATEFAKIKKLGRTHLQDAVPMYLGQEFTGYGGQIKKIIQMLIKSQENISELTLGGTAIGNGVNTHPHFGRLVIEGISQEIGLSLKKAENHFTAQATQDGAIELSGKLKVTAISLAKIANDLRWLASGPRAGLGEINLPSLQPGSSIMPGKINPVIPEAILQVSAQVIGHDMAVTIAGSGGTFELNTMLPVLAYNLLTSIDILANAANVFTCLCIDGITANEGKCKSYIENSISLSTSLVPLIGYDKAAEVANVALSKGKTIREIAKEMKILPSEIIDRVIDKMIL